jgi:hypothetical protein
MWFKTALHWNNLIIIENYISRICGVAKIVMFKFLFL